VGSASAALRLAVSFALLFQNNAQLGCHSPASASYHRHYAQQVHGSFVEWVVPWVVNLHLKTKWLAGACRSIQIAADGHDL
jgi:hypothetical protein